MIGPHSTSMCVNLEISIGVDGPITPCLLHETYDKLLGHYSIRSRTKKVCMGRCWSVRLSLRTAAATHPSDCSPWTPHLTSSWTTTSTISTSLLPMVNHDLVYSWHTHIFRSVVLCRWVVWVASAACCLETSLLTHVVVVVVVDTCITLQCTSLSVQCFHAYIIRVYRPLFSSHFLVFLAILTYVH